MTLDSADRKEIKEMIEDAIENSEKLTEQKLDTIISLLNKADNDFADVAKSVQTLKVENLTKEVNCPYRNRIQKLEGLATKVIIITSLVTGAASYIIPLILKHLTQLTELTSNW